MRDKPCDHCAELGQPGHKRGAITHLTEGKQQRLDPETGRMAFILPSPHRHRDTYTSALVEVGGIDLYTIDVLTNHRAPRGSVTAGYVSLSLDHLRKAQERVSAFLLDRIVAATSKTASRRTG